MLVRPLARVTRTARRRELADPNTQGSTSYTDPVKNTTNRFSKKSFRCRVSGYPWQSVGHG